MELSGLYSSVQGRDRHRQARLRDDALRLVCRAQRELSASGRPVLHQDTGFGDILPCGRGLFAFDSPDEVADAISQIESDYEAHCRAAREIAEEFFAAHRVLPRLIEAAAAPLPHPFRRQGLPQRLHRCSARCRRASNRPASLHGRPRRQSEAFDRTDSPLLPSCPTMPRRSAQRRRQSPEAARLQSGGATAPVVSAVICTYRRYELLKQAIASLTRQNLDRSEYEILVIDNSPDPELSKRMAADYAPIANLRWITEETPGEANARNVAIAQAYSPVVAFLDDDAVARPGWLEAILRAFDRFGAEAAAVGGKVNPLWGAPRPAWLHDHLLAYLSVIDWGHETREIGRTEWLVAANLAFRVAAVQEIGGFNTDLGRRRGDQVLLSNCEADVVLRLRDRGYRVVYEPDAEVDHLASAERLSQTWMRRRVVWQAISDYLMDPTSHFNEAGNRWGELAAVANQRGRPEWPMPTVLAATEDPDEFDQQMTALRNQTMLMLSGFHGIALEPGAVSVEAQLSDVGASDPAPKGAEVSGTAPTSGSSEVTQILAQPQGDGSLPGPALREAEFRAFLDAWRERVPEAQRGYFDTHYRRFLFTLAAIPAAREGAAALGIETPEPLLFALWDLFGYSSVEGTVFDRPGPKPTTQRRGFGVNPKAGAFVQYNLDIERSPLPMPAESFDLVMAPEVVQHFSTDPNAFFFEVNRVLKPGGFLLLTTPNVACSENILRIFWRQVPNRYYYFRRDGARRHNLEYGPDLLKLAVENAGFAVMHMRDEFCWAQPRPEIIALIEQAGFPANFRGDDMLFLCVKTGEPRERLPAFLYDVTALPQTITAESATLAESAAIAEATAAEALHPPDFETRRKMRFEAYLRACRERLPEGQRGYIDVHRKRFLFTMAAIPPARYRASAIEMGTYGTFLLALRDLFGYERSRGRSSRARARKRRRCGMVSSPTHAAKNSCSITSISNAAGCQSRRGPTI